MAAAILAPALALANDPHATDLTSTQVLGKLRMIHQSSIELGNIAQANSASANVKALGSTLVKDHQALDTRVTEYAMKNNIVLSGGTLTTETHTRSDRTAGTTAHNDMGGTPSGGTPSSSPNDRMGAESPALTGSTAYPQEGEVDRMATREEKMNALRSLRGTDFDREFLSRVVEKGNTWISVLQERRGKFDKTIDGEITKTIDAVKRHVSEAQRLSSSLRAT